jgi:hypothetical protein
MPRLKPVSSVTWSPTGKKGNEQWNKAFKVEDSKFNVEITIA